MQGINKAKHVHLAEALLLLERMLEDKRDSYGDALKALELRNELDAMFDNYERLLEAVDEQIRDYNKLFNETRTQFLAPKLREHKKRKLPEDPISRLLAENIRLAYGT